MNGQPRLVLENERGSSFFVVFVVFMVVSVPRRSKLLSRIQIEMAKTRKATKGKKGKKGTKKQSPWLKHVMTTFHAMRKTDKHCSFMDALKKAKATKNQM
jgi:hypothetical protein